MLLPSSSVFASAFPWKILCVRLLPSCRYGKPGQSRAACSTVHGCGWLFRPQLRDRFSPYFADCVDASLSFVASPVERHGSSSSRAGKDTAYHVIDQDEQTIIHPNSQKGVKIVCMCRTCTLGLKAVICQSSASHHSTSSD
jgi:hypothetical protein